MGQINITDIAKMANVSPSTVSRVVNNSAKGVGEKTREKILKIIQETNYKPNQVARSLVTKKSNIIGLIVPDISNTHFSSLVCAVEEVATEYGYNVILLNCNNDPDKERQHLIYLSDSNVAGIIYYNLDTIKNKDVIEAIKILKCKPDNFDFSNDEIKTTYLQHGEGMFDLTKYLVDMGHRQFAYIYGPKELPTFSLRYKGFIECLSKENIEFDNNMMKYCTANKEGGYSAMREFVNERKKFTCVICANDDMAFGAMKLLHERGLNVPEDISIVGFDNVAFAEITIPALTTMNNPIYEMGKRTAKILIDKINGNDKDYQNIYIPYKPELVIRETVKFIEYEK